MAELASDEQVDGFLEQHPGWARHGSELRQTYQFADFNESMGFVTRVGLQAERMFHHPDIDIRWNKVSLTLSTHSKGGITGMDLELAAYCDDIA